MGSSLWRRSCAPAIARCGLARRSAPARLLPTLNPPREPPQPAPQLDPEQADYFVIPVVGGSFLRWLPVIQYVASRWPYFNQSVANGNATHIAPTNAGDGGFGKRASSTPPPLPFAAAELRPLLRPSIPDLAALSTTHALYPSLPNPPPPPPQRPTC